MSTAAQAFDHTLVLPAQAQREVLATIAILSCTILLKAANVQLLEGLEFLLLFYVFARFFRGPWRLVISKALFQLGLGYGAFLILTFAGAAIALTRPFYLEVQGLYRPGVITVARAAELLAGVSSLLILTEVFRRSHADCIFTMKIFFGVGTLSAVASVVAVLCYRILHISLMFASAGRAAGLYGEGGPFGLFIVAVITCGWVLYPWLTGRERQLTIVAQIVNALAFVGSASKAGVVAVALLFLVQLLLSSGWRQRMFAAVVAVGAFSFFVSFTNTYIDTIRYIVGGQTYEVFSAFRPTDPNFVIGRVAGLYFVPRMIAAHPWTGVGWGNYGLVRNDVHYRGLSPVVGVTDQPGLGLYSTTAEIGVPAMLLLLFLLFRPAQLTRRLTRSRSLVTLALVQPMVHLCGGQLNLTYPWIVTAFALGLAGAAAPTLAGPVTPRRRDAFTRRTSASFAPPAEINPL